MSYIGKYITIGRFHLEFKFYTSKKKKSPFSVRDKVICVFGNSGHKWWPDLQKAVTITKMKYNYHADMYDLMFDVLPEHYFGENDFKHAKRRITPMNSLVITRDEVPEPEFTETSHEAMADCILQMSKGSWASRLIKKVIDNWSK